MEGVDQAFANTFGNYLLHGIDEVQLPDDVSWLPQTAGWVWVGVLLIALLAWLLVHQMKVYWRNRYRRHALKQLALLQTGASEWQQVIAEVPFLLKAVALQAYPRAEVAALSGSAWLTFLDQHYKGASFLDSVGSQLLVVAYQPPSEWSLTKADADVLTRRASEWIKTHRSYNAKPLPPRSNTESAPIDKPVHHV